MSDDWKVGDLAVCVDNKPAPSEKNITRLALGGIYRVLKVGFPKTNPNLLCLGFAEALDSPGVAYGFAASRFRKILPDEPIACETEFRILLDLSKKRVKA